MNPSFSRDVQSRVCILEKSDQHWEILQRSTEPFN